MKLGKKTVAWLLALALVLVFAVSASADGVPTKGTITIECLDQHNTWTSFYDGYHTREYDSSLRGFELYRIFDATMSFDEEGNPTGISYTCTDAQRELDGFETYFVVDDANNIIGVTEAGGSDEGLSPAAVQWIKENISVLGTHIENIMQGEWQQYYNSDPNLPYYTENYYDPSGHDTRTYHNLPFGYYFINSTVGSAVMINSTQPDVRILDKNEVPTLNKKISKITNSNNEVRDGEHDPWIKYDQRYALAQIGDTVSYDITVMAKPTAERYILSDSMEPSLTLQPDSIEIYVDGNLLDDSNYTLLTDLGTGYYFYKSGTTGYLAKQQGGEHAFEFLNMAEEDYVLLAGYSSYKGAQMVAIFNQDFLDTITEATPIVLKYNAVINENALNGPIATANDNDAVLCYGHSHALSDNATVQSLQLLVYKYEGSDASSSSASRPLNDVGFVLAREEDGLYFKQDPTTKAISWVENRNDATKLITGPLSLWVYGGYGENWLLSEPRDGYLMVDGLTAGQYVLIETDPLPGFNRAEDVHFSIPTGPMPGPRNNHTFRTQLNVANKTGTLLPSTGGMGVTVVYEFGLTVLAFAAILLLTKKQKRGHA